MSVIEARRPRVLAVIPAYNEEENIASTIEDLRHNAPGVDYLIVDDGSTDSTAAICAERGFSHVSLPVNLGLAGAFQTGMRYALERDYDYAVQFDADGQHAATYILPMVREAEEAGADIVIGSRFCTQKKPLSARMAGSVIIGAMVRLTTGKRINDPTSGMRLFDKDMIRRFALKFDYSPEPDTVVLAMRSGAKVSEMQVEMRERVAGESYLNFTKSISYMLRACISILFVQWFRKEG
ncbi:glycosyltransferase [Enterorhabdus mucosicola]|uniref:Glycosyltransferase n=1 Tax=Adlercreutzia mucosicola TaxID=580026 RepID=A0A6N8JQK7_9ACTN|nr:glycosyltransferase family 2 protein [Adlercreutzia mucosicola]MVX61056.1 glycosyltransferase [Adlercreutzia mucosicola]